MRNNAVRRTPKILIEISRNLLKFLEISCSLFSVIDALKFLSMSDVDKIDGSFNLSLSDSDRYCKI
jgi:hypothetical protein